MATEAGEGNIPSPTSGLRKRSLNDLESLETEAKRQLQDAPNAEKPLESPDAVAAADPAESLTIKIQYQKNTVTVQRPLSSTVAQLKQEIEKETGVPTSNQKLLFKGQLKDEQTLQQTGLKNGSKLMVIGTKPENQFTTTQQPEKLKYGKAPDSWDVEEGSGVPWSNQTQHKKVLQKPRPDDGWPGVAGKQIPLRDDQTYIPGLMNAQGTKVRLTFKEDIGQLWIGSAQSTQKIPYGSVTSMETQTIKEQPEYSIMRVQLGHSTNSNYWLYWVPSQSVAGIKMRVLGLEALFGRENAHDDS